MNDQENAPVRSHFYLFREDEILDGDPVFKELVPGTAAVIFDLTQILRAEKNPTPPSVLREHPGDGINLLQTILDKLSLGENAIPSDGLYSLCIKGRFFVIRVLIFESDVALFRH